MSDCIEDEYSNIKGSFFEIVLLLCCVYYNSEEKMIVICVPYTKRLLGKSPGPSIYRWHLRTIFRPLDDYHLLNF